MTAQVHQQYLVSLGFTVNQAQLRSFGDALKGTATSAAKLSAEVVASGVALTEMVSAVAKQFEDLYYMSQRTGATVTNLQAVSFAATQIGVSADEAKGAIEGFASAMRRQPGLRNLFEGVTKHKLTGDPEVDIRTFVRSQRGVADYIALQRADQLHIPEHLYLQYKNNNNLERMEASEAEYIKRLKEAHLDYGPDDRRWVDFENTLGHLASQFGIVGKRIAEDLRPEIQGVIEDLDKMVGRFGPADVTSQGKLGTAAGLTGGAAAGSGIMAIIGRVLGFSGWKTGPYSLIPMIMQMIKEDSENPNQPLRSAIRQVLGITDYHEPAMWSPGGSWKPGTAAFSNPEKGGSSLPVPRGSFTIPQGNITAGDVVGVDSAPAVGANNSRTSTVNVSQINHMPNVRNAADVQYEMNEANRRIADTFRSLSQKIQ